MAAGFGTRCRDGPVLGRAPGCLCLQTRGLWVVVVFVGGVRLVWKRGASGEEGGRRGQRAGRWAVGVIGRGLNGWWQRCRRREGRAGLAKLVGRPCREWYRSLLGLVGVFHRSSTGGGGQFSWWWWRWTLVVTSLVVGWRWTLAVTSFLVGSEPIDKSPARQSMSAQATPFFYRVDGRR